MSSIFLIQCVIFFVTGTAQREATESVCRYDFHCIGSDRCYNSSCRPMPVMMGDLCFSSIDCVNHVDEWSACVKNQCSCIDGFYESEGSCWKSQAGEVAKIRTELLLILLTLSPLIMIALVVCILANRISMSEGSKQNEKSMHINP